MPYKLLQKSLTLLFRRQTNIISAAVIIMATIIFSQLLGLIRQRLLVAIFGASDTLGIFLASSRLPDLLFQIIVAGALSSAFIPVFSEHLAKGKVEEAKRIATTLLTLGVILFTIAGIILFFFAEVFSGLLAPGFSAPQIHLMASLLRIIIFGELLFVIGSFLSAVLQSYNHFFIPGIAAALYNLGMIIGIVVFSPMFGIHAAALGVVLGASIFVLAQLPMAKSVGFSFRPTFDLKIPGVMIVLKLMWPRTLSLAVFQMGTLATVTLVSFLSSPGRNYVIYDYAQTLAFAPVVLFGQAIAQAAFPVLSRERERLAEFKTTFTTSFNQLLYLVLPFSVLFLVLRIPIVRLAYGASEFDWNATVLTGATLALFSISIFAQALLYLVSRGFYALHDTKTPLIIGAVTTALMIGLGYIFIVYRGMGIESLALAYTVGNIINLLVSMVFLDQKVQGFYKKDFIIPFIKIFAATCCMGVALYIPIKLLDQLVFDTTKTINLILLTGISSFLGLSLYLFLTWLLAVREAYTFIFLFKKLGNWREILESTEEPLDATRMKV